MSTAIDSKFAELKETIDLRRGSGLDAALKVVLNNSGKVLMDQIRATVTEADQEEIDLLKTPGRGSTCQCRYDHGDHHVGRVARRKPRLR